MSAASFLEARMRDVLPKFLLKCRWKPYFKRFLKYVAIILVNWLLDQWFSRMLAVATALWSVYFQF
jgi:hypothetical protein